MTNLINIINLIFEQMKKIFFLMLTLLIWSTASMNAQVRIGGLDDPNESAVLDLNATNAANNGTLGLALPRVELASTDSPNPLKTHVAGMTVYNTKATGDVTPGAYYNDGSNWIRIGNGSLISEVDGIVGNEVTNATSSGGLTRAGSGSATDPYTLGIADNGITTARIAANAVTTVKITDGAVNSAKILDATIETADLKDDAVTNAKLAGSIATTKLVLPADNKTTTYLRGDGTWVAPLNTTYTADAGVSISADNKISVSGVTSAMITNGTIAAADLADGAVTTVKIADGNVTSAKLAANSVNSDKIENGSIDAIDLKDATITGAKIAATTIAAGNLADGAVTSAKILDGTIVTADIADGAITAVKIATMNADTGHALVMNEGGQWGPSAYHMPRIGVYEMVFTIAPITAGNYVENQANSFVHAWYDDGFTDKDCWVRAYSHGHVFPNLHANGKLWFLFLKDQVDTGQFGLIIRCLK
jgi:hypothetical protein